MESNTTIVDLHAGGRRLQFTRVRLNFVAHGLANVFAEKNNKTLSETLTRPRYASLREGATHRYPREQGAPLGRFLLGLKMHGDPFYREFLNPYGDSVYCQFRMAECEEKLLKGLYLYTVGNEIAYIGRSFDPFAKRVDQGYGKIHPKNCYIDGQSTNCHLNSLIEVHHDGVGFFVCPLDEDGDIAAIERTLIQQRRPPWNVALTR